MWCCELALKLGFGLRHRTDIMPKRCIRLLGNDLRPEAEPGVGSANGAGVPDSGSSIRAARQIKDMPEK